MALTRDQKVELLKKLRDAILGLRFVEFAELYPRPITQNGVTFMEAPQVQAMWREDVFEFIEELKQKRFIQIWDEHNTDRFKFTARGAEFGKAFIAGSDAVVPDLDELLRDQKLREKALSAYNTGNYEDAIFKAYKALEERLRLKASASPGDIGADLVTTALHHMNGKLRIPGCAVPLGGGRGVYAITRSNSIIQKPKFPSDC